MNKEHPRMIDTRTATLERVSDSLIELRFKPEVKLDVDGMTEVLRAKRSLLGNGPADILAVLPPEFDFEMNVMTLDYSALSGGCADAQRLAMVTQSRFNEQLTNIYFRYHPRPNPTGIFVTEQDARKWLATKLLEPSAS